MDFKNLISWNRDGSAPVVREREEDNPVFALHRYMNRVVDDFFRSFDLPTRWVIVWLFFRLAEHRA